MPEFISKLQYKYYEKGEFTNEKARNPEETIELIKSFPWDSERGVDVQLTSPSVTISNGYGDYLKAAIYFNGKFCLYYLDSDGHLYEQHVAEIKDVCDIVTDFFNGKLQLQNFEKHLFSIGSKAHFENADFRYAINSASMLISLVLMCIFMLLFIGIGIFILVIKPILFPLTILYCAGGFFALQRTYFSFRIYLKSTDTFINISSGRDTFEFGDERDYKTYNKGDVAKIIVYGGVKSSRMFGVVEIVLIDGSSLYVPCMLINHFDLSAKFRNVETDYINGYFKQNEGLKKAGQ